MLRERWFSGRKTNSFTLQWHLTNACEGRCAHCYDRSSRGELPLADARRILDDFCAFCRRHQLRGQVCFTGGNPLLYPGLIELYRQAANNGLTISLLGNPASRSQVAQLVAIRRPLYYQLSLEGRQAHNDAVRGPGHFQRTIEFLPVLRELSVPSHVMLTLTRHNLQEVLPLAQQLNPLVDHFTFNRLARVGQGACLEQPTRHEYVDFLKKYLAASHQLGILACKDSLVNIIRHHHGRRLLRGCTGFGCGAAFNFVAVLPDGEAHACRKFPSPLGNVLDHGLEKLYRSPLAREYRQGSRACQGCPIRHACRGCFAVAYQPQANIFEERDPHCFMQQRKQFLSVLEQI